MLTFRGLLVRCLACCAAFGLLPAALASRANAQSVDWRYDYVRARQEAMEKGRPLVLDFGTENCHWCKQLDIRTFTDPAVIQLLNQRCIPLKVDANRSPTLAEALRIQNYPTLVFASADGRVLGSQEGFVEAGVLKDLLDRVVAVAGDPEWMLKAYQDAVSARTTGDFTRALGLLKPILEEGKGRPIHTRATQLLHELEHLVASKPPVQPQPPSQAENQSPSHPQPQPQNSQVAETPRNPEPARTGEPPDPTLDSSAESKAMVAVTEMARIIKGALASRQGAQVLISLASRTDGGEQFRTRQAQELLTQAREDFRKQQYLACLDRCELLNTQYADLAESLEANRMASEIKKNPEWTKLACDQLNERLGLMYLNLAESWLKKGEPQQAIFYLERVVQTSPNSRLAETAQVRLTQLQGQPVPRMQDQKR